jgi:hypothetical protein
MQRTQLTALELELTKMNDKFNDLEQQALLLQEKTEIIQSTSSLVTQNSYLTSSVIY